MYNLTVDIAHTFFVGDGQWLVHNVDENCRRVLELFSGPTTQIDRSTPGYRADDAVIITGDIDTYDNPDIVQADATNLEAFPDNYFDKVFFTNPFNEGLRDSSPNEVAAFRLAIYSEAARVLRPGGYLYISFAGNNPYGKILEANSKLGRQITTLGFEIIPPGTPFRNNSGSPYGVLHPALRGSSFGRPDGDTSLGWTEDNMKTLTLRLRG